MLLCISGALIEVTPRSMSQSPSRSLAIALDHTGRSSTRESSSRACLNRRALVPRMSEDRHDFAIVYTRERERSSCWSWEDRRAVGCWGRERVTDAWPDRALRRTYEAPSHAPLSPGRDTRATLPTPSISEAPNSIQWPTPGWTRCAWTLVIWSGENVVTAISKSRLCVSRSLVELKGLGGLICLISNRRGE